MKSYALENNTREAERLITHIEAIREHAKEVTQYCTGECAECPVRGFCDWDGNIDFLDDGMESIERLVDYLFYYDKIERRKEKEEQESEYDAWDAANRWAGIDPSWATVIPKGRI